MIKFGSAVSVLFFVAFLVLALNARAGRESGGGGGNIYDAEFRKTASDVVEILNSQTSFVLAGEIFDSMPFQSAVRALKLESTHDRLVLNGRAVSAINYPDAQKVIFNLDDWSKLDSDGKLQLVTHEILGLKYRPTLNDSNYRYSQEILNLAKSFKVESIALAMARSAQPAESDAKIIPGRTRILKKIPEDLGDGNQISQHAYRMTTEVAIRSHQDFAPSKTRVYRIDSSESNGIISAKLDHTESAD